MAARPAASMEAESGSRRLVPWIPGTIPSRMASEDGSRSSPYRARMNRLRIHVHHPGKRHHWHLRSCPCTSAAACESHSRRSPYRKRTGHRRHPARRRCKSHRLPTPQLRCSPGRQGMHCCSPACHRRRAAHPPGFPGSMQSLSRSLAQHSTEPRRQTAKTISIGLFGPVCSSTSLAGSRCPTPSPSLSAAGPRYFCGVSNRGQVPRGNKHLKRQTRVVQSNHQ